MIPAVSIDKFDVLTIRKDFPILSEEVYGKALVYFDNGATSQKPKQVVEAIEQYYYSQNANVHRGAHYLSQLATEAFENARLKVSQFIGAKDSDGVIFTKGTTDSINLVAQSWGRKNLQKGDEVLISGMEHHSNIVPWQMICQERGALLKIIPVLEDGSLDLDSFKQLCTSKTKMLAICHISNTLGTINPVKELINYAHSKGAYVLLDGAQAAPHLNIDVSELDCDFYALSGHKMFAPTGIGILYGKKEILDAMPPYQGGGEMIKEVSFEGSTYADLPYKFEAGTPNIAGAVGLGAAIDYLNKLDKEEIEKHERSLLEYATKELLAINGLRIYGTAAKKTSVISFLVDGYHPFDIGTLIDKMGIAVRTGHHCTQPLMNRFCIPGTVRASFAFYNTKEEIDLFIIALKRAIEILK
jgi:cysteine desulfurase/selenocysteine lyase